MRCKLGSGPIIVLGLTAALLAVPANASAGTKSQSTTLAAFGSTATLSPKCPKGQKATGGGFLGSQPVSGPPLTPMGSVSVYESRKVGQRTWRVSVQEGSGSVPLTVKAFAYCSPGAPRTKEKSRTIPLTPPDTTIYSAAAGCGGAGKAMAGGFTSSRPLFAPSNAVMYDSSRADKKTWRSRAFTSGGPSATLTSYVYCADRKKPSARTASTTSSSDGTLHTAVSAECGRGTKPVAGGFSQPNATLDDRFFTPYESFRSGKSWQTSAEHSGLLSTTLTSIAYCA